MLQRDFIATSRLLCGVIFSSQSGGCESACPRRSRQPFGILAFLSLPARFLIRDKAVIETGSGIANVKPNSFLPRKARRRSLPSKPPILPEENLPYVLARSFDGDHLSRLLDKPDAVRWSILRLSWSSTPSAAVERQSANSRPKKSSYGRLMFTQSRAGAPPLRRAFCIRHQPVLLRHHPLLPHGSFLSSAFAAAVLSPCCCASTSC